MVCAPRRSPLEGTERLRPGDPVNVQMTGALKPPQRLLGERSVPPVDRTWVIAGRGQIALQPAHRRGPARHVSGPDVQDRRRRDQRRQRQRAGDPINV
jgi:hypothetical protein